MPTSPRLQSLDPLNRALIMVLDLIRQSGPFRNQISLNGFFGTTPKGQICCACASIWRRSFIRRFPATRPAMPFVSCRWIAKMAWCLNA